MRRLAMVMGADAGVRPSEANQMISDALDLLVQIGIRDEVRRVVVISKIAKKFEEWKCVFSIYVLHMEDSS